MNDLTDLEKETLRYFVKISEEGSIPDEFLVVWSFEGASVMTTHGYQDIPLEISRFTLESLQDAGLIKYRLSAKGAAHCNLRPKGFAAVSSNFEESTITAKTILHRFDSHQPPKAPSMTIFISHASADANIAKMLADLFRSAFNLSAGKIRCTSVDGYRLPAGADTNAQLKSEVKDSLLFVALITPSSIQSTYVLFELGARWGADLPLYPVLARGANSSTLKGPLSGINALNLSMRSQVHQLLQNMSIAASLDLEAPFAIDQEINSLSEIAGETEDSQVPQKTSLPENKISLTPDELKILNYYFDNSDKDPWILVIDDLKMKDNAARHFMDLLTKKDLLAIAEGKAKDGPYYEITPNGRAYILDPSRNM